MRYYLNLFLLIFLFYSSVSEAQTDVSIRKKDFETDKPGFKEAWKHVTDGDSFYKDKGIWYESAFNEYLKAFAYNSSNPELNYKLGISALYSDKKEEAAGFLLKAFELKNDVAEDILLLTGRALQYAGRYSEAVEKFNSYLNSQVKKPEEKIFLAKKCIDECNSALILTKDTLRISIDNMGANINSNADDYSEVFTSDGKTMFFASRREVKGSNNYYPDSKFDENIFISLQKNGAWDSAYVAEKNLTTKYCETPLYIDSAGSKLYIYAGYANGGDIMMSENKKGEWKKPEPVDFGINSNGSETSFTFSPSGNEIYYVTDKGKDNIGGKDIYFIKKLNDRKWSKPQNAGPVINSAFDEESLRFSKKGDTLWFSSKGHNSIGGFDIFYSTKNKSGAWDIVKNYGYPVNTPWDEIFYYRSFADDSAFYFVSNRPGGFGGLDIYNGRILPPPPSKPDTVVVKEVAPLILPVAVKEVVLILEGIVNDSETGGPVIAKIDVIDVATSQVVITTASSDLDGSYRVSLPGKKSYLIDIRATGFISDLKRLNIPDTSSREVFKLNVSLPKIKVGKKVVLNNIFFETGKAILTTGSFTELERLLNILLDNPQMKIEISGHTDKTGSETFNFKLSENRSKAVVEYMVKKGIERSRMESRGFGSLQPIADNATAQGRAKNRRVEFKILEF